ncbi:hypothetical protein Tco_1083437, partial [Tanacetum coccineum]
IAKPITPPSELASEKESDPKQAQRDMDIQKNLALIAKYFKKNYKPTKNKLITSSNSRKKNVGTTPRYMNNNQTRWFGNQRTVTVARARETVGSQVVQRTRIQCFNCKEFRHFAKERRKPKRAKDYTYHKHKMLLCKQAEKGVPLQAEQSDWLGDIDEEIDEQELEAHYSFMAKIQEVLPTDSGSDVEPLEKVDSNVILNSSGMCDKDNQADQNAKECDDERAVLANLIANLKLDTEENKKIQKQLKKANASLAQELKECKSNIEEANRTRGESNRTRDRYLGALHDKKVELANFANLKYLKKAQSEKPCLYEIPYEKDDLANIFAPDREKTLTLEHESRSKLNKDKVKPYDYTKQNSLYKIFKPPSWEYLDQLAHYVQSLEKEIEELESDKADLSNIYDLLLQKCVLKDVMCSYLHSLSDLDAHTELQCLYLHKVKECECLAEKLSKQTKNLKKLIKKCKGKSVETKFDKPSVVRQPNAQRIPKPSVLGKSTPFSDSLEKKSFSKTKTTQTRAPQLPQTSRNTNPRVSTSTGVIHKTNVSRPQLRSTQMNKKVVHNNSQVKFKKKEVEDHHRISNIFNETKSVTACNDSVKSRTSKVNVVCATCGKYVFNLNHDACVSLFINDVNARTKKPKVVHISTRKPKSQENKSVATPHKKTVTSDLTIQKSKSYFKMLYENTNKAWKWWIEKQCTVRFGNDQFALILSYGDLVQGNITIKRVYYVEVLNHNLFLIGQFCDADLEVAFRKSTCFVIDLQGHDLLTSNHGSDLYTISLQDTTSPIPICFMAKASPILAWLKNNQITYMIRER